MVLPRRDRILILIACCLAVVSTQVIDYTSPPSITEEPEAYYIVDPRVNAQLKCVARGNPTPTYVWKKNGRDVELTDRVTMTDGTLVIEEPHERLDDGTYQCYANNNYGTALSNKITLRVGNMGRFTPKEVEQNNININSGAKLECNAPSGIPDPKIFWSLKLPKVLTYTNRVNQDPEGNLIFSNVVESDTDTYFCNALAEMLGEMRVSPAFNVSVLTLSPAQQRAPVLLYHPELDVVALRGETLSMKCLADAFPTPTVSWEGLTKPLPEERTTYPSFGQEVLIADVEFEDEGEYRCTASNAIGSPARWSVKVRVEAAPYWAIDHQDETIPPDSDFTMECLAEGIPPPAISWLVNGQTIPNPDTNRRRRVSGNKIHFTNAKVDDSDVYQCMASNTHGEIMTSMYLNVLAVPARIEQPPPELTLATESGEAAIHCGVFGSPKPKVTWSFNGQNANGSRYETLENGTLIIQDVGFNDGGKYTCFARNSFGDESASGSLDVKKKTEIQQKPSDEYVKEDENAQFDCSATYDSSMELTIFWERDGERLQTDLPTSRYSTNSEDSLVIRRTQMSDTNDYTCVAQTTLDEARATAKLIVQNVPSSPFNVRVDNADDIILDIYWSKPDAKNSPIEKYIIKYSTDFDSYNNWQVQMEVDDPDQTSATMNLSPWVKYQFHVIAVNGIGPSMPSENIGVYTTNPAPPDANPSNFKGAGTKPTNMIISWDPMGPEKQNAPGFKYLLRYKHQDATEWTPVIEIPDWTVSQYTVEPTETFQAYDITIQTANEEGSGPAPIATVGFSGEDVPNAEPTNVSVAVKGPTEINVMWNSVPSENLRGNLRGYKVRYSSESLTVQRQKREVETIVKVYDQSPAIMDDVTPYSRYTIDVAAFNNAGDGPYSAPVNAETPEGVPGPVANYVLTPLSAGFYLKWDFPDQPNGIVVGYLIKYQKMSGTEVGSEIIVDVPDGLIDRKKIGGLKEEVKYRVSIAAYTVIGEGESIVKEEFTRENGPPSVPEAPLFPLVGVNSINVTWVPDEEGPSVDEYEVYYRKSGSEEWILAGKVDPMDKNYLVIEDLDSGTTYDVRVRAVNSMGDADGPVSVVTTAGAGALATESSFVTEGWFIGLMCVIVFLLIILLIICIIKRNKGGKYHVSEKEDQLHGDIESMPHKDDDGGFGEYKGKDSPDAPDGKKPDGSQGGSTKGGSETDSMAEYGDQDTGQFNEDGSFIGQYGDEKKRKQQEAEADNASPAAFSTFV